MGKGTRVWVALLRGINVGGHNKLPMAELRELFSEAGCADVRTYIQSGNAVFKATDVEREELAGRLSGAIGESKGFEPKIMLLTRDELEVAAEANPFPGATSDPKTLHLWFLAREPSSPDLLALEELRAPNERYLLHRAVFYLHAPGGIGRSKLAERVERKVGVEATVRNWRTVEKLRELASVIDSALQ